jgi:putative hydrolase of the HAD superfamily
MENRQDIQLVILDLDGTICEYSRPKEDVLESAFDEVGLDPFFTIDEFEAAMESFEDADEVATKSDCRRISCESLAVEYGYDESVGTKLGEVYSYRRRHGDVEFLPGAKEALAFLTERYELGLITNAEPEVQRPKLESLDIYTLFETVVYAGHDTELKPHPEAFQEVLQVMGVEPDEALYIGDDLESDIRGADAVGIDTIWVTDGAQVESTNPATYQIESMAELPSLLRAE